MRKNNELEISITGVELDQVEEGDLHDISGVGFDVVEEKTMRVNVREGSVKSDPGLFDTNMFKSMRESSGSHSAIGERSEVRVRGNGVHNERSSSRSKNTAKMPKRGREEDLIANRKSTRMSIRILTFKHYLSRVNRLLPAVRCTLHRHINCHVAP